MIPPRFFLAMILVVSLSGLARGDDAADALLQEAAQASQRGEHEKAIAVLTDLVQKQPNTAIAYYLRGRENFQAGQVKASVADFDKYVALAPKAEPQQWERGIAYYYVGEFAKGASQFELYQTFHDQDVENSAWRYLCVARAEGMEQAQANMLPIENDSRVPMMQIYDLYRGKLKPADVLKAAEGGNPTKERLNTQLFYAHLYLGLWHEAAGRPDEAKKHLLEAEQHKIGHYMWDVAHVHCELLRAKQGE